MAHCPSRHEKEELALVSGVVLVEEYAGRKQQETHPSATGGEDFDYL
jgi:hypothetical protein